MIGVDPSESRRRIRLILQSMDQLPTLSSIAVRLLEATSDDRSHAREVIALVANDPSLSSRVLQLCRRASRGVNLKDGGIDRAVILLGFDEVRTLALAVEVFELLDGRLSRGGEAHGGDVAFDRTLFWRHCLATGIVAEWIARRRKRRGGVSPGEAFLAGLLHDLGMLALYAVLPRTFDRVCDLAESRSVSLDAVCRRMIGAGTHSLGKYLAQHWRLPAALIEAIWLCEQPAESIPECPGRDLVSIVTFADALARDQMIAHRGHGPGDLDPFELGSDLGLSAEVIDGFIADLPDELAARSAALGLGDLSGADVLRESMERAKARADRAAEVRDLAFESCRTETLALKAAAGFFNRVMPGDSVTTVATSVLASAAVCFEGSDDAALMLIDQRKHRAEFFRRGSAAADPIVTGVIAIPPDFALDLAGDHVDDGCRASAGVLFPFLATSIEQPGQPPASWSATALELGPDVAAFLLRPQFERDSLAAAHRDTLCRMWGAALCAAILEERAGGLSEQLVEANRRLVEAQEYLAEKRAMAALGELASGAAHEMNNPLTVICGRSQILSRRLAAQPELRAAADEIARQCHRLSDLITSLSLYAESPVPHPQPVAVMDAVNDAVMEVRRRIEGTLRIDIESPRALPRACFDRAQIAHVIRELLQNAYEAAPDEAIELAIEIDPRDDRLSIVLRDRGGGFTPHALSHAFDPFFSQKPAGRQAGLGLARARRLADLNRGEIELANAEDRGAIASLHLTDWRARVEDEAADSLAA